MLPFLKDLDFMSFSLMKRQPPSFRETIAIEYHARMQPFAAFGAAINAIPVRHDIPLITPVVDIFFHVKNSGSN